LYERGRKDLWDGREIIIIRWWFMVVEEKKERKVG
jgi:hypothetical protein